MSDPELLKRLGQTIAARGKGDPSASYVASLFAKGGDKLHLVRETADLWFHCLVLLAFHGLAPEDVLAELARREGVSGLEEKRARGK